MQVFERLRNAIRESGPRPQPIQTPQPEIRQVLPYVFQPRATAVHAGLLTALCPGCKQSCELYCVNGNLCLLGCSRLKDNLIRIDTTKSD